MALSQQAVDAFRIAWKQASGKDISNEDAWAMAMRAVTFVGALVRVSAGGPSDPLTDPVAVPDHGESRPLGG